MKKKSNRKVIINILSLLVVALIVNMPVFLSKINVYYNDGIQYIAKAYGTYESMKENIFFPNIISSFANGFGYSWRLFSGPFSIYGIIIIKILVNNFVTAYKIFAFLCIFLSGLFMYKFIKTITKIDDIGLLAGILYICFPYHITTLYNNSLNEIVSFIFIPIVFLGIYNIFFSEEKSNKFYFCIGMVGLILTQNFSAIIVAIFALSYSLLRLEILVKEKKIRNLFILNIIFILLLTCFYWLPEIETITKANYIIFEENNLRESVYNNSLKLSQLFITKYNSPAVYELGIYILIMSVFSFMSLKIIYKPLKEHYVFFIICTILTIFMATKYFPWRYLPKFFLYIEYPYKMLLMTSFFLSIVCAINMYLVIIKFNIKDVLVISVISLVCVFALFDIYFIDNLKIDNIENYNLGFFSGKENEVVPGSGKGEYLTVNGYKDRFYIATRENDIYVLKGKAIIESEKKSGTNYYAKIKTFDSEYTIFECPYIYYPGYEIRVDGIIIQNFETENGFLGFAIGEDEDAVIEICYSGTELMKNSLSISILSLIIFIIINIREYKMLKNEDKKYIIEKVEENNMEEKNA